MKKLLLSLTIYSIGLVLTAQIPTSGLVVKYDFSGGAKDSSGNSYDGTVNGAMLTTDRFGKANSAYDFNGSSAYISIPTTGLLNDEYTYSIWVSPDVIPSSGSYTFPLSIGNNAGGTNIALTNTTQQGWSTGSYNIGTPIVSLVEAGRQPMLNQWVHVVGIKDDSLVRLYINGRLNENIKIHAGFNHETKGLKTTYGSVNSAWIGGRDQRSGEYFDGKVDDVRLYNRALSDCEVMDLYLENHPCRSSINDTTFVQDTTFITIRDTLKVSVMDTLIINANLTGISAPNNIVDVLVYPNPTSDKVTIAIKDYLKMNGYSLKITDALSKEIWKSDVTQASFIINLNSFGGKGTYFITIYDGTNQMIEVRKIILQ